MLEKVSILDSHETPAYVEGIGSWVTSSFEGRRIASDFFLRSGPDDRPGDAHGVDALTGATVSARAVVQTVNRAKNAAAARMGIEVATLPGPSAWPGYKEPIVIYVVAALLLSILVTLRGFPRASPWPRRAFLAANLVLGGFVFNAQLSMEHVVRLARLDFPGPSNPELFVLVAGAALLTLLLGPVYCANVCPFGAAQELLGLLGLGVRPSARLERRMRYLRYVTLAVFLCGWALTDSRALVDADPLAHAFAGKLASGAMLVAGVALLLSLFSFRFWCRTFCPLGALLSLGGRFALAARLLPPRSYHLCDMGASRPRDVECLQCNRCLTHATLTRDRLGSRLLRFPARSLDRWARMVVLGMLLLIVGVVLSGSPGEPAATSPSTGTAREVDVDRIRSLIEEGKLSDEEALFWSPATDSGSGMPEDQSPNYLKLKEKTAP
jgi:hypothetical protein